MKKFIDNVKQNVKDELDGLVIFSMDSPFLFGRYIGLEFALLVCTIYAFVKKKKLIWVDR